MPMPSVGSPPAVSGGTLPDEGGRFQWHAIIIGVDRYPAFPKKQLSGCVNDANAIRRFLVERVQVPEANIRCLTSPREPAVATPATAAIASNIRAEFEALKGRVKAADHVVLYYAGHGLPVSRVAADGGKDRYYGFAPEDIDRDGQGYANLILGSEIYGLLCAIEAKGATATVIADTCHSGASTRALDQDVRERSLQVDPLSEEQWQAFTEHHPALQRAAAGGRRAMGDMIGPFGAYPGGDFVMLTGCLDSETAKEDHAVLVGDDGQPTKVTHGLMTLALLKELESVDPGAVPSLRWMDFYDRLRRTVAQRAVDIKSSSQTISLEGRREKPVFGGAWRPFAPGFTVRKAEAGVLMVDGGEMQGLEIGAVVAIHPPDTSDFHNPATPGVDAVVEAATPMTSTVRLREAAATVADLSRARLLKPGPNAQPIVVRVVAGAQPMPKAMRDALATQPDDAHGFTLIDDPNDAITPAHAELRRWTGVVPKDVWPSPESWAGARDGWVLVRTDRFGVSSTETKPVPTPDDIVAYLPDAGAPIREIPAERREEVLGAALAHGLSAYGRYLRGRDRRAGDETLASMLAVTLRAGLGTEPSGHATIAEQPLLEPVDGVYSVTDNDWIWAEIRVLRRTDLELQVGWVMFSDDGNVNPLWPTEGTKLQDALSEGSVVFVGWDRESALYLPRRADQGTSMYTLRVIACTGPNGALPLNIASLAQQSVQAGFADELEPARGIQSRGEQSRRPAVKEQPAWYAWDLRLAVASAGR